MYLKFTTSSKNNNNNKKSTEVVLDSLTKHPQGSAFYTVILNSGTDQKIMYEDSVPVWLLPFTCFSQQHYSAF